MKTKETIRQSYSIKISKALHILYGTTDAYFNEWKSALSKINKIAKTTKKNELENELQIFLINTTK
jgi:hypothetical protein